MKIFNPSQISSIIKRSFAALNYKRSQKRKSSSDSVPFTSSVRNVITFIFPVFWPASSLHLKALVVLSLLWVMLGCVVNIFVPIYNKKIVDILNDAVHSHGSTRHSTKDYNVHSSEFTLSTLAISLGLKVMQGVGSLSLLNCVQSFLWIKLEQNSRKEIQVRFFTHLHQLSVRWQLKQKTGDILGSLERGSAAVTSILEKCLYCIIPTMADVTIAVIYMSSRFNSTIGLIVLIQVGLYLYSTIKIVEWRSQFQKSLNSSDNDQKQQAMESLLNFETVKYYANEDYEIKKYSSAIDRFNKDHFALMGSINLLQLVQLVIVNTGMLFGSWIMISLIVDEQKLSVGDYVLFASYMGQLILPLNYLGCNYRNLMMNLTAMEDMVRILHEQPEIQKSPGAKNLLVSGGQVEFRNVSFSYESGKKVIKDVSFVIPAKKTIALVGPSGSGKSSIIRLLTRLYDVDSGEILIDGHNVKNILPASLRRSTGVVPQDTILFHDTIANNIRYAKLNATEYEVHLAADYAQIQDKIQSLPDGYKTTVGERGLKLSGGEKQRIAIARMFLKDPPIILLDEATSALDVNTEKEILQSFEKLCRTRTCLMVTHRLQTVQNVDEILVLKDGEICERGTHLKLLAFNGKYASMWRQQTSTEQ